MAKKKKAKKRAYGRAGAKATKVRRAVRKGRATKFKKVAKTKPGRRP